jgi:hypothetical protein
MPLMLAIVLRRAFASRHVDYFKRSVIMQRIFAIAAICAIFHAPFQSRGDDQPATLARLILRDEQQKQVLVNVRMIEVSLTKMREAGLNYPELTGSPLNNDDTKSSADDHSHAPVLLGIVKPSHPLFAFLDDLQKKVLAKTIAEPALITLVGRDACYNSGGQLPILQQRVNGNLSTEFATFGTELTLKSEALEGDRVRLTVKPRFAELDKSLEVSVGGRIVPGLNVRECQASAELASGDTMVLRGMPNKVVEHSSRHGKVIESVVEKELLVLVTATLSDIPTATRAKPVADGASGYSSGAQQPVLLARPTGSDAAGKFQARTGDKK